MGRKNRHTFYEDKLYHIYNKVISETDLFKEKEDYWNFMVRYSNYFSPYFKTYAYCLIPNHFHFLVKVKEKENIILSAKKENTNAARNYLSGSKDLNSFLENQFSRCFSGYTIKYNNKYKRQGPLFKQGVKRVALNAFRTFEQQMHYIHFNPIHHHLVNKLEAWKHSSYLTYISDVNTQLPRNEVIEHFGGKEAFIEYHKKPYIGDVEFD